MSRPCWVKSRVVGSGSRSAGFSQPFSDLGVISRVRLGSPFMTKGQKGWWENSASNVRRWKRFKMGGFLSWKATFWLDGERCTRMRLWIFGVFDIRFLVLRLLKDCNSYLFNPGCSACDAFGIYNSIPASAPRPLVRSCICEADVDNTGTMKCRDQLQPKRYLPLLCHT